jgi:hypothetical protein
MGERCIAVESTVSRHFCLTQIHEPSRVYSNRGVLLVWTILLPALFAVSRGAAANPPPSNN